MFLPLVIRYRIWRLIFFISLFWLTKFHHYEVFLVLATAHRDSLFSISHRKQFVNNLFQVFSEKTEVLNCDRRRATTSLIYHKSYPLVKYFFRLNSTGRVTYWNFKALRVQLFSTKYGLIQNFLVFPIESTSSEGISSLAAPKKHPHPRHFTSKCGY